jgi:hypothetical protein
MHAIRALAWHALAQMEEYGVEFTEAPVEATYVASAEQMSFLSWIYNALGPLYLLLFPLFGFLAFGGACLVVAKCRRPADIASYFYFAAAPFFLAVFGVVHGMIASFQVIAAAGTAPKPSDLASGISTSLFAALVGLMCSFPAYATLWAGYLVRTLMLREGNHGNKSTDSG